MTDMIPKPVAEWLFDGFMSRTAPTEDVIMNSPISGLVGFAFAGPGWYEDWGILLTATGEEKQGKPTYHLRWYASDPRPQFLSLFAMVSK